MAAAAAPVFMLMPPIILGAIIGIYEIILLHRDVTRLLGDPDLQSKFAGAEATPSASPAALSQRLADEVIKWEKLLRIPGFASGME